MRSAAFLAGLLSCDAPAFVTAEDVGGPHRDALKTWQELGFVGREPGLHPRPSCPHCAEGVPYRAEGRLVCSACGSAVDECELFAWPVRREAFLAALAVHLGLRDGVRAIDGTLWELGSGRADGNIVVCFFHAGGTLSESARARLSCYRRGVVFATGPGESIGNMRRVSLLGVLDEEGGFAKIGLSEVLGDRGLVRFDPDTGALRVGATLAGEVSLGSREWALLACLAEQLDHFVPYRDLKREVLRCTGGTAEADEATFCQKLKSRIKKEFIPDIDRLIVTSNKADGYRLRREA